MTLGELEEFMRAQDCRLMLSVLGGEFLAVVSRKGFEVGRSKAGRLEVAVAAAVKEAAANAARKG